MRFLVINAIQQDLDFVIPSEVYNLVFLQERVAILWKKGIEIMDLVDSQSSVQLSCHF